MRARLVELSKQIIKHVLGRFTGVEISANELGKPIYICSRSFAVRGTQRRFPPNPLKTLFRLSKVLLDL